MKINIKKLFRKRLKTEIENMGFSKFTAFKINLMLPNYMADEAIANFRSPKDYAIMLTQ